MRSSKINNNNYDRNTLERTRLNTAVLYFSLTPAAEARHKSFCKSNNFYKNYKIAGLLRNHTQKQIKDTGLQVFVYDENNQTGDNFGERLANAFSEIFKKGFQYVIAVGNDTPRLQSKHITEAHNYLTGRDKDIVIGPAPDGGTWLMGFSSTAFVADQFIELAWNTTGLLSSFFNKFQQSQRIQLLEFFEDIDDEDDLMSFLNTESRYFFLSGLVRKIAAVISLNTEPLHGRKKINLANSSHLSFSLRAPPLNI